MKIRRCRCLLAVLLGLAGTAALAQQRSDPLDPYNGKRFNDFYEEKGVWKEDATTLPAFPEEAALKPIYLTAVTSNQFLVDIASVSLGKDQVVRYSLVVRTRGGAENISHEGIRCETGEWKMYATGRRDPAGGSWHAAKNSDWRYIENKLVNRYHAALARDFFCPGNHVVNSTEEARDALQRGLHPSVAERSRN